MWIIYLLLKLGAIGLSSWLWHKGGDEGQTHYRKWYVPLVMAVTYALCVGSWIPLLFVPSGWAMLQWIGYGVNAPVHVLWCRLFGYEVNIGTDEAVEFCTRVTCAVLWSVPTLFFGIDFGWWLMAVTLRAIVIGLVAVYSSNVEFSERGTGIVYSSIILL